MEYMYAISLRIVEIVLMTLGFAGCIIPALPGPLLCLGSVLMLNYVTRPGAFSLTFVVICALLTLTTFAVDIVFPVAGAKIYDASKYGLWGACIGCTIGIFFIPPFGIIIGAFSGAALGEFLYGKKFKDAFKTGAAAAAANIAVIFFKLAVCAFMAFFYFWKILI